MFSKHIVLALAFASAATAAPRDLFARQRDCQGDYSRCIAAGTPEVACQCTLAACAGEDNARNRAFCASATANLGRPTSVTVPAPASTVGGIPGGCNPAHPGSCPTTSVPITMTVNGQPQTKTVLQAPPPAQTNPTAPKSGWTVQNLVRYCGEDKSGCDYNFDINTNDGVPTRHCTVIRKANNAPTESWYDVPCTTSDSDKHVRLSWGYATNPGPPFAVMTIVNQQQKAMAYFGVANVNEQPVTPSNPFGSGSYADIGPQPVTLF